MLDCRETNFETVRLLVNLEHVLFMVHTMALLWCEHGSDLAFIPCVKWVGQTRSRTTVI